MNLIMSEDKDKLNLSALVLGWAYADCCAALDRGDDPRKAEMPVVLERMTQELSIEV